LLSLFRLKTVFIKVTQMEGRELYTKLKDAYSNKNLNHITGKLIDLYKSKNYCQIRTISNRISKFVPIDDDSDNKRFSKLIMLYHPDKGEIYRKAIDSVFKEGNFTELESFSHVNLIGNNIPPHQIEQLRNKDILVMF